MGIDTSALFTPIVINGHSAKNRLAVAPMTRNSATRDGRATETMARCDERFARGGFGKVITGRLDDFDPAILGPVVNLEETELAM